MTATVMGDFGEYTITLNARKENLICGDEITAHILMRDKGDAEDILWLTAERLCEEVPREVRRQIVRQVVQMEAELGL